MNTPAVLPQATWRVVWFSLLAAALSLVAFLLPLLDDRGLRGAWAVAIIVGNAGFQLDNARHLFLRSHPGEARTWMWPASLALYGIAFLCLLEAGWAASRP